MKRNFKSFLILVVIAFGSLFLLLFNFTSSLREKRTGDKAAPTIVQEKKISETDKLINDIKVKCNNKISENVYEDIAKMKNPSLPIRVLLYSETKPNEKEVNELKNAGVTSYVERSWVNPSTSIRTGHFLVEISINDLGNLCELTFIKLISSSEAESPPN